MRPLIHGRVPWLSSRTRRVIGAGATTAALLGVGYVGLTWLRYGKQRSGHGPRDPLLDRFMPTYEVRECHATEVAAPAQVTYAAALELNLRQSALVRAIFRGRELLMGSKPSERERKQNFLEEVFGLGWRVLADEPGRELVVGAMTQPWEANVVFRGLAPEDFAAFADPGYAKIIWTLAVEPAGRGGSVFRTETRVATTDPESRKRFRRYWSLLSPGILLIRYEILRLIRREAGRRVRAGQPARSREAK